MMATKEGRFLPFLLLRYYLYGRGGGGGKTFIYFNKTIASAFPHLKKFIYFMFGKFEIILFARSLCFTSNRF